MCINKYLKVVSILAFALLLCPAEYLSAIGLGIFTVVLLSVCLGIDAFKKDQILGIREFMIPFGLTLLILPVFILRWSNIVNPAFVAVVGLILCFSSVPALQAIVTCIPVNPKGPQTNTDRLVYTDHIILLLISLVVITFTSASSPLLPYNWICDSNCVFTAGRGIIHGKIVYRDLIDHKGVVMHLINAIGALITPYKFTGVWLVEILFCYAFLVITTKIRLLFEKEKTIVDTFLVGAFGIISYGSRCFEYGNTAEEFCLPLLALILYLCMKAIVSNYIGFKRPFLVGLCTGCIFWIKFNLCGALIGIALFIAAYLIIRKEWRILCVAIAGVLSGFLLVSVPIVIFYLATGSLDNLVDVYFIMNIFKYNLTAENDVLSVLGRMVMFFLLLLNDNYHLIIFLIIGALYLYRRSIKLLILSIFAFLFSVYFIFIGTHCYPYYLFILTAFAIFGWIPIELAVKSFISQRGNIIKSISVPICIAIVSMMVIPYVKNLEFFDKTKEDYPTYCFSRIINSSDDRSFICYDFIDRGFYTYMETDPEVPFYSLLNADKEKISQIQRSYIDEGDYNYIITTNGNAVFEGYELIETAEDPIENDFIFYLYSKTDN